MSNTNKQSEYDLNEARCVILEMPGSQDEGELDLSRILHKLTRHFEDADYEELLRAQSTREEHDARLYLESAAAAGLPFEEDAPR
jgi:hypothetical protein